MIHVLRRSILVLPCAALAILLRDLLPRVAAPATGVWPVPWQLDPLTFVFVLLVTVALACMPVTNWRNMIGALVASAVLIGSLLLQYVVALPIALLILAAWWRHWRWAAASILLGLGLGLLMLGGGTGWHDPRMAGAFTSWGLLLLLAAAYIGIDGYPMSITSEPFDPLLIAWQPLWLLPLLRSLEWGPWNTGWALATLLLGGVTAVWSSARALWSTHSSDRVRHIANVWTGSALASIGLLTPVGTAAALWYVLVYTLNLGLLLRSRWAWWAAPVPFSAAFVACWLIQGAAAASGAFVLAGGLWLAASLSGLATIRQHSTTACPTDHSRPLTIGARIMLLASVLLGVLAPLTLQWLIVPAVDQLQGGLTPFGLLDIWPWVGLAALDAGQRRVAVLPSIAVALLVLVMVALVWLSARMVGWWQPDQPTEHHAASSWTTIRQRVWWAGAKRRG